VAEGRAWPNGASPTITPSGQLTPVQTGHDRLPGRGTFGSPILAQVGKMEQSRTGSRPFLRHDEGRWAEDAMPFPGRSARYWLNIHGSWPDPAGRYRADLVREGHGRPTRRRTRAAPSDVNLLGHEGANDATAGALSVDGPSKLERLTALKSATTIPTTSRRADRSTQDLDRVADAA